jgi:hypothetical protein
MAISDKMSVGVVMVAAAPNTKIKIATITNVWGLKSASLTIHTEIHPPVAYLHVYLRDWYGHAMRLPAPTCGRATARETPNGVENAVASGENQVITVMS